MGNCIFCNIIEGEIPSSKVYENEYVYAFNDISPVAPVHVLIIPKQHIESINDLNEENAELISKIFLSAAEIAKQLGVENSGYRVVTNCGPDAGQTVEHVHFHLLGGRDMTWPPG